MDSFAHLVPRGRFSNSRSIIPMSLRGIRRRLRGVQETSSFRTFKRYCIFPFFISYGISDPLYGVVKIVLEGREGGILAMGRSRGSGFALPAPRVLPTLPRCFRTKYSESIGARRMGIASIDSRVDYCCLDPCHSICPIWCDPRGLEPGTHFRTAARPYASFRVSPCSAHTWKPIALKIVLQIARTEGVWQFCRSFLPPRRWFDGIGDRDDETTHLC
jgi:hypothetical protein